MKNKTKKKQLKYQIGRVESDFTGSNITKYSGLKAVIKFIDSQGIGKLLNSWFPTEKENATKFSATQLLLSIVLASTSSINRMSRIETFTKDCLVGRLLKLEKYIDAATFKTRLKSMGMAGAFTLHELFLKVNKRFIAMSGLKKIILDLDSTVSISYGNQEGAEKGYNPKKRGAKSYHPLLCFVAELKTVVNTWFRCGSAYTANGSADFIRQTIAALPGTIRTIWVRADSGFFSDEFMSTVEQLRYRFLIKVKLKGLKNLLKVQRWYKVDKNMWTCTFEHKCKEWEKPRTFFCVKILVSHTIGTIGEDVLEYDYFCYCSNLNVSAKAIHQLYGQRAESENWIAQVKGHLMAGRTLTDTFSVNDMLWQLSVMAYNISVMMRWKAGKSFWREEHLTFRDWFICLPGRLVRSGRSFKLRLYEHEHDKDRWLFLDSQAA